MVSEVARHTVTELLKGSRSYAAEAGITMRDKPAPLYQLMVLVILLSKPISADLAVAGTRELLRSGYRTPKRLRSATWQHRVDALTRAHYRRYDESTATILEKSTDWLLETYRGDLRELAATARRQRTEAHRLLQAIPGVGPVSASIYLREVQAVWTWVQPYADERVRAAARDHGLPHTERSLAMLAESSDLSTLGAALIRES